jgi:SpoVK/Ycf46/Vps4 family AAA+-type ATPase|uniref:ATPase AAA-type core domain-containing protein n=1 Tax=viral metagenome TaxID=1070528 RepID=A0A6C0M1B1_9ZZZZ
MKSSNPSLTTCIRLNEADFYARFDSPHIVGPQGKPPPLHQVAIERVTICCEITCISDLLRIVDEHPVAENVEYNINMKALHRISEPLRKLDAMIGMESLKEHVVDQIIYFMQDLHVKADATPNTKADAKAENGVFNDYMHTVIYGPPGTGKTEVAQLIGAIFSRMGVLKKTKFKKVTRSDLIAGYLGQTAIKTADVIKECLGGVLFIDEAYALGNADKRDSFSKECIDTLCEALSDHKSNLMVIVAGYEKDLNDCFFNANPGLNSRFTWRYNIDNYTPEQLAKIYEKKVLDCGWTLKDPLRLDWFQNHADYFTCYGRDMETLLARAKIAHSRRIFGSSDDKKRQMTHADLERGLTMFISNDEVKRRKEPGVLTTMYL